MAKGNRGGQKANTAVAGSGNIQPTQKAQPTQPQVDDTQQASDFSVDYNKFMAMTDDEKADVIGDAIGKGVPDHLSQSDFQKFIYNSGLNDKPDIVDDATLNSMNGTEIFRTVNSVYDSGNDISYSADQIAKQVMAGKVTRTSDSGGSAYGRGLYFADTLRESSSVYGNTTGDVKRTAVMRAKLNNNAKVIDSYDALTGAQKEINSGSKLGKVLAKCDITSAESIYAMTKGYNVITSGNGYYNVLNRNAMTMSSTVKPKNTTYKW